MFSKIKDQILSRVKEPNDVYSAIYPLFILCNYLGLAPYDLKKNENGRQYFQFGWSSLLKSFIVITIFCGFFGYSTYITENPFKDEDDVKIKIRYFQEIFSSILSVVEIIIGLGFASKIIEVFKNISEVDDLFKSLAVWVTYKTTYVNIVFQLVVYVLVSCLSAIVLLTLELLQDDTVSFETRMLFHVMRFFTKQLPYFINILMEIQYVYCLNIIRFKYKLLNDYLDSLVEQNSSYNGWMAKQITTIQSKSAEKDSKIPKGIMAITDPVFIIDQIATLHIKLTDTAHLINAAFSVQQLLRITIAFVSIVTALFSIAMSFAATNNENVNLDIFFTLWAFSNAVEVIAIVWITSETCEEANTCPRILHKIRNNTNNVQLQDTIEIYSLQMFHNKLYFTVCGLFPLDYTLLYTIVAGVTTYLVILIQFNIEFVQNSNHTANGTSTM